MMNLRNPIMMYHRRVGCAVMLSALAIGCNDADVSADAMTQEGAPRSVDPIPILTVGVQAGGHAAAVLPGEDTVRAPRWPPRGAARR